MGQQATKRQETFAGRKRRQGVIGAFVQIVALVIWVSLLAWLLLSIGFSLCQLVQGQAQTQKRINTILVVHTIVLKKEHYFLVGHGDTAFESGKKSALASVVSNKYALDIGQWSKQKMQQGSAFIQQKTPHLQYTVTNIWHRIFSSLRTAFLGATAIVVTRLWIFLLSLPLFLLFICLGFVDGLVQRDIRKFQGARESTYLFHTIKRTWRTCFFVPLFLYFVWPWPTDAMWFLIPMAIAMGFIMQISLRFFKKYV